MLSWSWLKASCALAAGVPYVGLVASRKRGEAVVASLDVDEGARARVHTPAGLDIALIVLLALNLASERWSFSRAIDRSSVLQRLDRIGRK